KELKALKCDVTDEMTDEVKAIAKKESLSTKVTEPEETEETEGTEE
ncbi:20670_t:CDS:2, partial [Gigaspora margarita]